MNIRSFRVYTLVMGMALTILWVTGGAQRDLLPVQPLSGGARHATTGAPIQAVYGQLPLQFEVNRGQVNAAVKFLAHGLGYQVFLAAHEAVLVLADPGDAFRPAVLRLQWDGAASGPRITGVNQLPGVANYYIGRDSSRWHTGIPTYAGVRYEGVYPGIDLVFYGNGREVEHDFVVAPGAHPDTISLSVQGADSLVRDPSGDLVLGLGPRSVRLRKPFIYQQIGRLRREVAGSYVLKGPQQFGFEIAAYDASRPLIIDPVLEYSTYLGGTGDDYGYGIALDTARNVYLTGATSSTDFPLAMPAQPGFGGGGINCPSDVVPYRLCYDAFVTKLNADGSALIYSTYYGLPGDDEGRAIAVDTAGNAYVTGYVSLNSDSLPEYYIYKYVLALKLNPTGGLAYAAWFGTNGAKGLGIAVDGAGRAYVTGEAPGSGFPTTPDAIQPERGELIDAFVSVLNPAGDGLEYSTYLGGNGEYCEVCYSSGRAIAVDSAGTIYVTGQAAPSFPTTPNAYQRTFGGFWKAFVAQIDPTSPGATGLLYASYLGGSLSEFGNGIALDAAGHVYITGSTQSDDFPTTPGALDRSCGTDGICNATDNMVCDPVPPGMPPQCHVDAKADVFVAKMDLARSGAASLIYATYIGGSGQDVGHAIAVDASGRAYVTGQTVSPDFPLGAPLQATIGGNIDAFVLQLNVAGSALGYATFLGGGGDDAGRAIAVDGLGNAHVTGYSGSVAFPTANALRPRAGGWEAIVVKIAETHLYRGFLPLGLKNRIH